MSQPSSPEFVQLRAQDAARRGRGTVVITGASTGIGEATALHLASLGYRVLAGVRKQADFERLRAIGRGIEPMILDVTNEEHITALAELVDRTEPSGLTALINNAGIGAPGPIESVAPQEWRDVMEVNVIGVVAVTQALLPSLLRAGGRVINMGSGGGRIGFPLFGPYNTSKFAIEGFTDVLRREVGHHGVKVSLIQPGIIATPIYSKHIPISYDRMNAMSPEVLSRYRKQLDSAHRSGEEAESTGMPPIVVAEAVAKAVGSRFPKTRYVVGSDSRTAVLCARFLPDRVIDLIIRRITSR
ncbi:MAG: SDR family oxidoreductase [Solirubrobacteraceae bacterium]|nr:SDR family oxidoreductase [Solirubrobacteraceae bacterium]